MRKLAWVSKVMGWFKELVAKVSSSIKMAPASYWAWIKSRGASFRARMKALGASFWAWTLARPYRAHLIWLVIVAVAAIGAYVPIVLYVEDLVELALDAEESGLPESIVAWALKIVAGALFCWRVVKVAVFFGSPMSIGLEVAYLRENGAENGRPVTVAFIEEPHRLEVLLGVVARSHPRSDKIVRSRVEMMIMVIPGTRRFFALHGSRISFPRRGETDLSGRTEFCDAWKAHHRYWKIHSRDANHDNWQMVALINQTEPRN